jgi:hypothetical protein
MQKGNVIILILGIIVICSGIFVYFEASSFQKGARLTEGIVVHVPGSSYRIRLPEPQGVRPKKNGNIHWDIPVNYYGYRWLR